MEGENAIAVFTGPVENELKYTYYVADGDVKHYECLREIYGSDIANIINKLERHTML